MGWTGCFPNRIRLQRPAAASRRSSYETEDRTEHSVTDGHRHRHWQGGFSHRRVWRRREDCLPQEDQAIGLKDAFEKLQPCIVGMEACLSAHFVSRVLRAPKESMAQQ